MIDMAAIRDHLVAALSPVTDWNVYPRAVTGVPALPAVLIGSPDIEFDVEPCLDLYSLPVIVGVAMDGTDLVAIHARLETLWIRLATELRDAIADPAFTALASRAELTTGEAGDLLIGRLELPAYTINLKFYG